MKKFYCVMLLFFSVCLSLNAQNFAPVGAEWTMGFVTPVIQNNSISYYDSYKVIHVADEVMKEGKLCRVLVGETQPHSPNRIDTNYIYNENNAVYAWYETENRFQKIYDFGASVGDSWDILINENMDIIPVIDTFRVSIDSVFEETIDGVLTNSYLFSTSFIYFDSSSCLYINYDLDQSKTNSKLGYPYYIFPFLNELCATDVYPMDEVNPKLRCYTDFEIDYHDLGNLSSCDYQNFGLEDYVIDGIEIKMNTRQIDIISENESLYDLSIYTVNGQKLRSSKHAKSIDVSGIHKGVYILFIQNGNAKFSRKIKI